ncbi:uncharacterized protein LOC111382105 [Olea europaea var. sylvestris]|uniref:uncharacterized protein LOC111382105 n=1 Tax=Olea europaea var. sylvestris TaxID=158386 RepID=UPI000C1D33E7|nr:uncharacterized protein LOC111382105 [Olea europaea var. sylvestris]
MFKIRHIAEGHICASNIVLSTHRQVTKTVVSTCIKYKYTSSRTIYTLNDIRNDMLHTYGVSLNYVQAWRSREETLKVLRGASIRGWKHCKPVVMVDDIYLNGHYDGTLFTLRKANGDRDGLCFMSDRHNSIKRRLKTCIREHVMGYIRQNITKAFNAAVRAYTLLKYEYYMQQLGSINEKIRGYLDEVGPERWSRFHMPSNRYFTITSNIVDSVNTVAKHKEYTKGTFTTLLSKYKKKMREMVFVFPNNQAMFSVNGESSSFVVDIENRTCTCRMLQVNQLHGPHALTVFTSMKMDPYEYCSYYYTSEAFRNTYQETIFPVGNLAEWIVPNDVHNIVVIAPNQKQSCGRPTEKRFRPAYEENIAVKCGRCGESDHNRRTCNSLVPLSQSNKNKERKRMKTGNTH